MVGAVPERHHRVMTETASKADIPPTFRLACGLGALVAGLTGVVMLVSPDPASTDRYFSWGIRPAPLAAVVGGFYLASAVVFAVAAVRGRWCEARALAFGVIGFCLPTLVATAIDAQLFDFTRWQAIAWVVLFALAPLLFGWYLRAGAGRGDDGARLPITSRAAFVVLAVVYGVLAAVLLIGPTLLEGLAPFTTARLSGRFLGSWATFLAVLAVVAAWRARAREALLPGLALVLWPVAAVAPVLRVPADLAPAASSPYLVVLALLGFLGAVALYGALSVLEAEAEPVDRPAPA